MCDQCQALMINGVYCHELGCPTAVREKREREAQEWLEDLIDMDCEEVDGE